MLSVKNLIQNPLSIAFLGGGLNSAVGRAHFSAVSLSNSVKLVAGCFSLEKKFNQESAEFYNIHPNRVYENLEQLIVDEKDNLDAVVVLTPTPDHFNSISQLIKSGIPVISEKALVGSVKEANSLKSLLQKTDHSFLSVIYNYTGYPMVREAQKQILSGHLGTIQQIMIEMPQEGFARINSKGKPNIPQTWRLEDSAIPTVSLDLGVHLHNMVHFLVGEKPIDLVATENRFGAFTQIIDSVQIIANYTNNIVCNFRYGKATLGHRNGLKFQVYGNKGAIEWIQAQPEEILFSDQEGQRTIIDRSSPNIITANDIRYERFKVGHPAGFVEALANYYDDIFTKLSPKAKDTNYTFGIEESLEGLSFFENASRSSRLKKWVQCKNI